MDTSIILAKILGPYCIIVSVGFLINRDSYQKLIDNYAQNPIFIYFGGILALFFGLLIVTFHNVWEASWVVIITLFGWIGLIKGIFLLTFPKVVLNLIEVYKKNQTKVMINLLLVFIIGLVLVYYGFCPAAK